MMKLTKIGLLLLLFGTGCSGGGKNHRENVAHRVIHQRKSAVDTSSVHNVIFDREITYGTTNNIVVGEIASFAVDNQSRVFIADEGQTAIEIFTPDGHYLKSLGRRGKGPAEFGAITSNTCIKIHAGRLYVSDYTNPSNFFPDRIQVFSLDSLAFIHTAKLLADNKDDYKKLAGEYPGNVYPLSNGKFLVGYRKIPNEYRDSTSFIHYVIQNSAGNIIKGPVFQRKDRINLVYLNKTAKISILVIYPFPFYGKSLLILSDKGRLFVAKNTQRFKISVYDVHGKYMRSFQHAFHKVALSRNKLIHRYKHKDMSQLGKGVAVKMIQHAHNLPKTWPALHSMLMDDQNRLWISTIVKNQKVYRWWVLNKKGKVLAKFNWPRDKPIKVIKNGYIYTMETNKKTEVQQIVRYKIQMQ
jgi:hypothetical protein